MENNIQFSNEEDSKKEKISPKFFGIVSLIFGIGSIVPPIALVFSVPGILCGIVAIKKGETTLGFIGALLSGFFLVIWLSVASMGLGNG